MGNSRRRAHLGDVRHRRRQPKPGAGSARPGRLVRLQDCGRRRDADFVARHKNACSCGQLDADERAGVSRLQSVVIFEIQPLLHQGFGDAQLIQIVVALGILFVFLLFLINVVLYNIIDKFLRKFRGLNVNTFTNLSPFRTF